MDINQAIVLFRSTGKLLSRYLYLLLCSGLPYAEILRETRGSAGQANISLSQCREMEFEIPGLAEQKEIVRRVEPRIESRQMLLFGCPARRFCEADLDYSWPGRAPGPFRATRQAPV